MSNPATARRRIAVGILMFLLLTAGGFAALRWAATRPDLEAAWLAPGPDEGQLELSTEGSFTARLTSLRSGVQLRVPQPETSR